MIHRGDRLTLDIEKPAAGGRMLARHAGQILLVSGTIPGERVIATVERVGKGVAFAETAEVLSASPDRRAGRTDWRCGGNVLSHIAYARQCELKGDIIRDAFTRIGRLPLSSRPEVVGSPETGYRMRARLHVQGARIGFFREGTHELCDAGATGQLLSSTVDWIAEASEILRNVANSTTVDGPAVSGIEISENMTGDQRGVHMELRPGTDPEPFAPLTGPPTITDTIRVSRRVETPTVVLERRAQSFFQGNRFLLEPLVERVTGLVADGPIVDLYAGVGLFGLALAALGLPEITLVEGDPVSSADLAQNAKPFGGRATVRQQSVETFLARSAGSLRRSRPTFIVDPPRTGMTREALAGIINSEPRRIVYVSCDVATLARDARTLIDAGYEVTGLTGMDLFPNTGHVETIAVLDRR
jgi:23S rRNA (uracil1939-C5)-methyltransferase